MDTALPFLSPLELNALLGRPGGPLLLDVRKPEHFAAGDRLVAGAVHCTPDQVPAFARELPPREAVVYCVYGHHVSQDAAAVLQAAGWSARWLAGGIAGGEPGEDRPADLARWRATPPLTVRKRPDLGVTGEAPSRWVTRARPKIDRVACPWLVLRFIDPRARFFYVPADQVLEQARALDAVAFDVEGGPITHHWEKCSFDALLEAFDLHDPALDALATIVRGADTGRPGLAPECAGLLAVSLGLSRLHADDDLAMLAAALPVYDALHAWCRDGQGEKHTWKVHAA